MDFDRLDAILKDRKISRRKLALAVGIPESTMSMAFMRRSGLSAEQTIRIANYLGIDYFYLAGLDEIAELQAKAIREAEELQAAALEEARAFRKNAMRDWNAIFEDAEKDISFGLLTAFDQLNDLGQIEAVKRVEELTEIPRYRKDTEED